MSSSPRRPMWQARTYVLRRVVASSVEHLAASTRAGVFGRSSGTARRLRGTRITPGRQRPRTRNLQRWPRMTLRSEEIEHLVFMATHAPSVHNTQPWRFTATPSSLVLS